MHNQSSGLSIICFIAGVVLAVAVLLAIDARAADMRALWHPYEDVDLIDGLRIYSSTAAGKTMLVDGIDPAATTADFLAADECATFYLVAYKDQVEVPSNPYSWCPEIDIPFITIQPGQIINFSIQVQ